jgi:hypothetical protein
MYVCLGARGSQEEPGVGARGSQEEAGGARRSQEEPWGARRSQEEPGGARRSQEEPGGARRSQGEPGGARSSQEEAGGSQEEAGGALVLPCPLTAYLYVCVLSHVSAQCFHLYVLMWETTHMWQSKKSCHLWDCSVQSACTSMPTYGLPVCMCA